jgi:hypothetical protein
MKRRHFFAGPGSTAVLAVHLSVPEPEFAISQTLVAVAKKVIK